MIEPAEKKSKSILKEIGKFLRIFVFLALISLITIHWSSTKGIFDYKSVYGDIANFFKTTKEKVAVIKVPEVELSEPKNEFKNEPKFVDKPDSLEIPKIEITAPIIFIESNDNKEYEKALKNGVVHYSDSVLPGEVGQTIILGHSAPSGWPKINYDWVFSRLNELEIGDEVIIYFQNREYPYLVTKKYFLQTGQDIPSGDLTNSNNMLILISCWPPGVNLKRIAVEAELAF